MLLACPIPRLPQGTFWISYWLILTDLMLKILLYLIPHAFGLDQSFRHYVYTTKEIYGAS